MLIKTIKISTFYKKNVIFLYIKYHLSKSSNLCLISFVILTLSFFIITLSSCTKKNIIQKIERIQFALVGNTNPESPFKNISKKVIQTFNTINQNNPLFVIHLGNMVYGGAEWMGIREKDISQQYEEFIFITSRLKSILYTVKGEKDLLNNSTDLYINYTKRKKYYSFNYGMMHFVIIDTIDLMGEEGDNDQLKWLKNDLNYYKDSTAIIIFTHNPLFVPSKSKSSIKNSRSKNYSELHKLFLKFPVKAVFSGHLPFYYKKKKDGIIYVIAGCGGYNHKRKGKRYNQFYIVNYFNEKITIFKKKLP